MSQTKETQRAELHKTIRRIANDLHGSVDGIVAPSEALEGDRVGSGPVERAQNDCASTVGSRHPRPPDNSSLALAAPFALVTSGEVVY